MKSCTFETGLSDYHKAITTILTKTICKGYLNIIFYRDYKFFNQSKFDVELKLSSKDLTFSDFQNIFLEILNNSATIKKKNFHFNHNPFTS